MLPRTKPKVYEDKPFRRISLFCCLKSILNNIFIELNLDMLTLILYFPHKYSISVFDILKHIQVMFIKMISSKLIISI